MTYSKAQLRKRYVKGIILGILVGAFLMVVGGQVTQAGWLAQATETLTNWVSAVSERGESDDAATAEERAEALREQVAAQESESDPSSTEEAVEAAEEAAEESAEEEEVDAEESSEEEGTSSASEEEGSTEEASSEEQEASSGQTSSRLYKHTATGAQMVLPAGWSVHRDDHEDVIGPDPKTETAPRLLIRTRTNADRLPLSDVYNGAVGPAYYYDAYGGVEERSVGGYPAVSFRGVVGYQPTTITVVQVGETIVELHDLGEQHQSSGVYESVLASFSVPQ